MTPAARLLTEAAPLQDQSIKPRSSIVRSNSPFAHHMPSASVAGHGSAALMRWIRWTLRGIEAFPSRRGPTRLSVHRSPFPPSHKTTTTVTVAMRRPAAQPLGPRRTGLFLLLMLLVLVIIDATAAAFCHPQQHLHCRGRSLRAGLLDGLLGAPSASSATGAGSKKRVKLGDLSVSPIGVGTWSWWVGTWLFVCLRACPIKAGCLRSEFDIINHTITHSTGATNFCGAIARTRTRSCSGFLTTC